MSCEAQQASVTSKAEGLVTQLSKKSAKLAADIKEKSKDIDPNVDTSGPDVWVGMDLDIKWDLTEFILDLPEVRLVEQRWSLDVPQVTVKEQKIIFDVPSVRMKTVKTGEYPETICKMTTKDIGFGVKIDVPECTVKWSPIYMDVPEPYMQRNEIVLGVPEFAMGRVDMILGVPEFSMRTQRVALHLPQITVKNVNVETKKAEEKGKSLAAQSRVEANKLTSEFQETAKIELGQDVKDLFYCFEQELSAQKHAALEKFAEGEGILRATLTAMISNKVPDDNPTVQSVKASLAKLQKDRDTFAADIAGKITELHAQQQGFFEKLVGKAD
jgi:hypothetical protein